METIKQGSRGAAVRTAQEQLVRHGYKCDVDGVFGPGTKQMIMGFQKASGLTPDGIVGSGTWAALLATKSLKALVSTNGLPPVMKKAEELGYQIWDTPYRLWLFGIRSPNREANAFDDTLGCVWFDREGQCHVEYWPGTTDPGIYWMENYNPDRVSGAAILVEGQYLNTYKIDLHGGSYEALCQRNTKVRVYRDSNRDKFHDLDPETIREGWYGINLHAATRRQGGESTQVNKWSAGCQVHATQVGFARMMELAHLQVKETGLTAFTYTLLDEW
jgi:hypothetical protein